MFRSFICRSVVIGMGLCSLVIPKVKDREFLAEMSKAGLDIDSLTGEQLEKIVRDFFSLDRETVDRETRRAILRRQL